MKNYPYWFNVADDKGILRTRCILLTREMYRKIVHIDPITREVF